MVLTIRYGLRSATRTFASPPTVREIKSNTSLRAELGYGDNVRVLVGGVEQPGDTPLDVSSCTIETAANQKAR